jgi:polyadenylate-binding protein
VDEEQLKDLFTPFGTVSSARIPRDDKGANKGFGFVSFETAEEATKAVGEMHLKVVGSKPLYVGLAERRAQRQERLQSRFRGPQSMDGGFKGMGPPGMGMGPMMPFENMKGGKGMRPGPMGMGPMMRPMMPQMQMMQMQQMQMMQMQRPPMMVNKGMAMGGKPMGGKGTGGLPKGKGGAPQQAQAPVGANTMGISPSSLAAAPPAVQKQMLGEKLYGAIHRIAPELAGKITGMMLEMDNAELLVLLDSPDQLAQKVNEARNVLAKAGV